MAARCRNLINPTPEKLEARFKRLSEDCGYAYVGFSSVLDGPILVHGTTDDKAVLSSTLAREQWRTEERAMEWAMLLWLIQVFKSTSRYIRIKLMATLPTLDLLPRRPKAKSSVGNSSRRRRGVTYVGYGVYHAGRRTASWED
ncbi:hypothetical protein TsFJ059_009691 [Trichoderma semiorbis]|uniref:Uncharacterized protein n=1 Tax=Trichoderma semiorbis TaxID=1491008 RepID=A0A9P8HH92_9HYPO|nr:hypothetical protein TsFJ059_009691 [Trichoderma semiorbis]